MHRFCMVLVGLDRRYHAGSVFGAVDAILLTIGVPVLTGNMLTGRHIASFRSICDVETKDDRLYTRSKAYPAYAAEL